ncbi:glycosyltransferase [Streptodolium elevatio]
MADRGITVLVDGRIDGPDGIGRYTRQTVAALRARAETMTTADAGVHADADDALSVRVEVLGPTGTGRYSRAEGDELAAAADRVGADLVHVLDYRMPWRGLTAPVIVSAHDVVRLVDPELCYTDRQFTARFGTRAFEALGVAVEDLRELTPHPGFDTANAPRHREFYARMMRLTASRAARIVVPTQVVLGQFAEFVDAGAPLAVSPWGVDHLPREPDDLDRGFLLYVGQARVHKRVGALVDAYAASDAYRAGVPLVLVGRDFVPGSAGAEQLREHPCAHRVMLLDTVDDALLAALYARAIALVHLASHEGYGFPPLEALAAGARVVASDIPTLREVLGDSAEFVHAECTASVAAAIDRVVSTPDPPALRIRRSARICERRWSNHADTLIACYRAAVTA